MDYSGFVINFSLYRRVVDKTTNASQLFPKLAKHDPTASPPITRAESTKVESEPTHETLLRMASVLPKGSLIVADGYFGGMPGLEVIVEAGYHGLLSCSAHRPAYLFKDYICKELKGDGHSLEVYGELKFAKEQTIPFVANSFKSEGKAINTLSTVFTTDVIAVQVEKEVIDDSQADKRQHKKIVVEEMRPIIRVKYSLLMDFVDAADSRILEGLTKTRKSHWTSAYVNWMLSMMGLLNAQKLYQSATGDFSHKTQSDWNMAVIRCLLGQPEDGEEHPPSEPQRGTRLARRCRSCKALHGKDTKTTWFCSSCNTFICKHCEASGDHFDYACQKVNGMSKSLHPKGFEVQKPPAPVTVGMHTEFEVEDLLDTRKRKRTVFYKVKWRGYPVSEATWEKASRIKKNCSNLINEFKEREERKKRALEGEAQRNKKKPSKRQKI